MKTESMVMYVLRLAGTLLLITSIVAACLAGINAITAPVIAQLNAAKTQEAIETVLPGGYDQELSDYADETGLVSKVYQGANGYAFEVTPAPTLQLSSLGLLHTPPELLCPQGHWW